MLIRTDRSVNSIVSPSRSSAPQHDPLPCPSRLPGRRHLHRVASLAGDVVVDLCDVSFVAHKESRYCSRNTYS
jgi:hypothetical protein